MTPERGISEVTLDWTQVANAPKYYFAVTQGAGVTLLNRRNARPEFGDTVPLYLCCPLRVDGLRAPDGP
jgi:hypothetical protein